MHILFIGYGKTSQRVAKQLFQQDHQITTISRTAKPQDFATHLIQDIHQLDLSQIAPVDVVYVLSSPASSTPEGYQATFVDAIPAMLKALKGHPVKKVIVVSSTRVYGEQAGERIDDTTVPKPIDAQGEILRQMELLWQAAYPEQSIIIRPTGIYGTSIARMVKLAQQTSTYPNIHYSNRIHIEDLARFLAHLIHVEHHKSSYIVTNNQPIPLHEIIQWFQRQLGMPELSLSTEQLSGKQIYASNMQQMDFDLQHPNCFEDYLALLVKNE